MSVAYKMPESYNNDEISEYGKRAAAGYILSKISDLRTFLENSDAFSNHEIEAIASSVEEVLARDGKLTAKSLAVSLHSRSIPKDFASKLAVALSA